MTLAVERDVKQQINLNFTSNLLPFYFVFTDYPLFFFYPEAIADLQSTNHYQIQVFQYLLIIVFHVYQFPFSSVKKI